MKRFLLLALCALFALNAGARTLYVDAKRPNNKGNGLSAAKAKKTIQAAINVARKGDTILVYPGTYAPIKTNNLKITIKSVKGQKKTKIVASDQALADLSKHVSKGDYTEFIGNASSLTGFLLDGKTRLSWGVGTRNGRLTSCTIKGFSGRVVDSILSNCLLTKNVYSGTGAFVEGCTIANCTFKNNVEASFQSCVLSRCYIRNSEFGAYDSTFVNCLIADTSSFGRWNWFCNSTAINCTIANNTFGLLDGGKMFYPSQFYNCILWKNYIRRYWHEPIVKTGEHKEYGYFDRNGNWVQDNYGEDEGYEDESGNWIEYNYQYRTVDGPYETGEYVTRKGPKKLHNVDPGNVYKNTDTTNKNPKFVNAAKGNYKLKKGSYCINKGKLTKAQKKLVGTKDLAGKKRIKGKAIDRGCYEY